MTVTGTPCLAAAAQERGEVGGVAHPEVPVGRASDPVLAVTVEGLLAADARLGGEPLVIHG